MWFDNAVIYQIYPLGLCGAPRENDGVREHRILRVLDWIDHIKAPEAVVIAGIAVEIDVEPVLIRRIPTLLQYILKSPEPSSHMIEHAVQNHFDAVFMQIPANSRKILVGSETTVTKSFYFYFGLFVLYFSSKSENKIVKRGKDVIHL